VIHALLLAAVQAQPEAHVTPTFPVPPPAAMLAPVGDSAELQYETVRASAPRFNRLSRADIVITFVPICIAMLLHVHVAVPLHVPLPPRSFDHVTCVAPTWFANVPPSVIGLVFVLYVAFDVGEVTFTTSGVTDPVSADTSFPSR